MASLLGGAECGPSNPLAAFAKSTHQDRSLQLDRTDPRGESSSNFRQHTPQVPTSDADSFFARQSSHSPQIPQNPSHYDLSSLSHALPSQATPHSIIAAGPSSQPWSSEFANSSRFHNIASSSSASTSSSAWAQELKSSSGPPLNVHNGNLYSPSPLHHHNQQPFSSSLHQPSPLANVHHAHPQPLSQQGHHEALDKAFGKASEASNWELAFKNQENITTETPQATHESLTARPTSPVIDASADKDALARTAGDLLNSVSSSNNPKFASSSFMSLMRKFRDREAGIEGDKVVEQIGPSQTSASNSGLNNEASIPYTEHLNSYEDYATHMETGYDEVNGIWNDEYEQRRQSSRQEKMAHAHQSYFQGDGGTVQDDLDFDNDLINNGPQYSKPIPSSSSSRITPQQQEWDHLQREWDAWEATSTGMQPLEQQQTQNEAAISSKSSYIFTPNNPYLYDVKGAHVLSPYADANLPQASLSNGQQQPARLSSSNYASVLQKEAFAQVNSQDPGAWLALGIKQQENEREDRAISALLQAVDLRPEYHEAWLALAISYSNESAREATMDAIQSWIGARPNVFTRVLEEDEYHISQLNEDRHAKLVARLIRAANSVEHVDADIQIALGTLFCLVDDYSKAGDCFTAALSVRPDDHLLYNRVGASLANQGQVDEAAEYYNKALEIQPDYARARYNIAISFMNNGQQKLAVEHLLTALQLQQADADMLSSLTSTSTSKSSATLDAQKEGGVTSDVLWDALSVALTRLDSKEPSHHTTSLIKNAQARDLGLVSQEFASM